MTYKMQGHKGALLNNEELNKPDIDFQYCFLTSLTFLKFRNCIELGAGPLRITLNLLSYFYDVIDVNDIAPNLKQKWIEMIP